MCSLAEARPFDRALLSALGFTPDMMIEGWLPFEAPGSDGSAELFGVTESPIHVANECRIACWAERIQEVDRLAAAALQAGARNVEGPSHDIPQPEEAIYYVVFLEDPSGNRLEMCCRH